MDITKYYEKVIKGKMSFKDILDLWNEGDTYDLLYLATPSGDIITTTPLN